MSRLTRVSRCPGQPPTRRDAAARRLDRVPGRGLLRSEFAPLLSKRILPLIDLCQEIRPERNGSRIPKRIVSAIEDAAHDVETFLDDYDARSNKTFATLTEFVACARGFAEIDRTIQHVLVRFPELPRVGRLGVRRRIPRGGHRTLAFADVVAAQAPRRDVAGGSVVDGPRPPAAHAGRRRGRPNGRAASTFLTTSTSSRR